MNRNPTQQEDIRESMLDAAERVIAARGVGALTHRALAAEAGVSLSSTTYHFKSKAEILVATFERVAQRDLNYSHELLAAHRASAAAGAPAEPRQLIASLVAEIMPTARAESRLQYELQLMAADHEQLRPIMRAWSDGTVAVIAESLKLLGSTEPEGDARILAALTDGLRLDLLTVDADEQREAEMAAAIERAVELVLP